MKRERRIAVILATLATTVLCGCGGASAIAFSNEEAAKDALSFEVWRINAEAVQ